MRLELPRELILAIAPSSRGIAYTYFEGPLSPVDWGLRQTRSKNKNVQGMGIVRALIEQLQPDVLVLPEYALPGVKRGPRLRRLHHLIATYAVGQAIEVKRYSRADIRKTFAKAGAVTRQEIAEVIAGQVHAFAHRLPPVRKLWMSEDSRMSLFDAAALSFTYFADRGLFSDECF